MRACGNRLRPTGPRVELRGVVTCGNRIRMAIDHETVRQIAHLARLELSPAEEEQFVQQLEHILAYFSQLDEVNTTGVEPATDITGGHTYFREDKVTNPPADESLFANAPSRHEQFFKVPKIIE